jgi:two-component system sensor histidine kinase HydH
MATRLIWRLTLPLLLLSLLLLLVVGVTAAYMHARQQKFAQLLSSTVALVGQTEQLEDEVAELRNMLRTMGPVTDPESSGAALSMVRKVEIAIGKAEESADSVPGRPMRMTIREQFVLYDRTFQDHFEEMSDPEHRARVSGLLDKQAEDLLLEPVHEHQQEYAEYLNQLMQENAAGPRIVVFSVVAVGICGAIGGIAAGVAVARRLRASMLELSIPVHVAAGALNSVVGPVQLPTNATYGEIRDALNQMAQEVTAAVERLQDSLKKSLRAEQFASLGQLAAGLAHEIRNPLTSMKSLIQLARDQGGASQLTDRDLAVLDEEVQRLDRQVQTFLDFARPPRLRRTTLDPGPLIRRTVQLSETRARQQNVDVTLELPATPLSIDGDPDQLQQVLLNLLLNALNVLPQGGRVEIQLMADPAARTVSIQVADNGPGITPDNLERIFEPFFSTHESGTGIGLAVSRRIIEQHDGTITAANRESGGAVFTIMLPQNQET